MANDQIKRKKKRPYTKDPQKKLDAGQEWRINFVIDPDVGQKIIDETKSSSTGAEYGKIMNARLRKAYGIKS